MNQAQSNRISRRTIGAPRPRRTGDFDVRSGRSAASPDNAGVYHLSAPRVFASFLARASLAVVRGVWFLITLPFRVLFWVVALLGRVAGIVIGFSLMVVGIALWAGPFFLIGIPLFLIGLVLTLRCLG